MARIQPKRNGPDLEGLGGLDKSWSYSGSQWARRACAGSLVFSQAIKTGTKRVKDTFAH